MRDVEALDAAGKLGEHERVGERLLNGLARGLEDAEALRVGLVRVLAGEIDEGFLVAALGDGDLDLVAGALGEQRGEGFAIVEVDGDEDGARDVLLVDVELLEEGGEDVAPASKMPDPRFPVLSSLGPLFLPIPDPCSLVIASSRLGRSSQKNSRRSTILPLRMWKRLTARLPSSKW